MRRIKVLALTIPVLCLASAGWAQDDISAIPLETIPGNTNVVVGNGETIGLQGDTAVGGDLAVAGEVSSETGFRFPDGTTQQSAASAPLGLTGNLGLYSNMIAALTPPNPYTEICFKDGSVQTDIHGGAEPTTGGNCLPGDVGWIFERFEREGGVGTSWVTAKSECLQDGMRLPEPFEWGLACESADLWAIENMTDNWEWSSNSALVVRRNYDHGTDFVDIAAITMGHEGCSAGNYGSIARNDNNSESDLRYRCVR